MGVSSPSAAAARRAVPVSLDLSAYTDADGVIDAVIVLLLWLYVISLVVLTGGLINAHFRRSRGLPIAHG